MTKIFDFKTYLYFWGALIGCLLTLLIYIKRKDLRTEIVLSGTFFAIVGVFIEYMFFQDYWQPPLLFRIGKIGGLEDIMFGFAAGGFGSVFYKFCSKKQLTGRYKPHYWIIPLTILSEILCFVILTFGFKINSIYSSSVGWLIPALVIICIRRDLLKEAFFSMILCGLILVLGEGSLLILFTPAYLEKYFLLYGKVPTLFNIFTITEFIWGCSFGALVSTLYEFARGQSLFKISKKQGLS